MFSYLSVFSLFQHLAFLVDVCRFFMNSSHSCNDLSTRKTGIPKANTGIVAFIVLNLCKTFGENEWLHVMGEQGLDVLCLFVIVKLLLMAEEE